MAEYALPKRASELIFYVSLVSQADTKKFQVNPTLAAGDVKVTKDGGAAANLTTLPAVTPAGGTDVKVTVSATEMTADNVSVKFIDAAGAEWCDLQINIQTSTRAAEDLAFPATSGRSIAVETDGMVHGDVKEWLGVAPNALASGRVDSSVGAMAANVLTAAATAADFGTEIAAAVWNALTSGMSTAGSIGKKLADWVVGTIDTYTGNTPQTGDSFARLGAPAGASVSADIAVIEGQTDDIGAAGAGLTAVPWNATWDAEVQSEVDDALVAQNLDHVAGTGTGIPAIPAGTYIDQIMDDGTATFDRTTDSLQAIRDRGDVSWITGAGGSLVEFRGFVTKSGATYYVSFSMILNGQVVSTGSLSSYVVAVYDEDGTDLTFSGSGAAGSNNVIHANGTLGTAVTDNRPIMVKVGATYGGTAYSAFLAGASIA